MTKANKTIFSLYTQSIKQATQDLRIHWRVLVATLPLLLTYSLLFPQFLRMDVVGGFIAGLLEIVLLSFYYQWIVHSKNCRPESFSELFQFDPSMFYAVLNVAFILFVIEFLLGSFQQASGSSFLFLAINLIIFLGFNAIPEIIYNHKPGSFYAFPEALEFTKRHWIVWLIPIALVSLPTILIAPQMLPVTFAVANPLLPASLLAQSAKILPFGIVFALLFGHWFMLFRSRLYDSL